MQFRGKPNEEVVGRQQIQRQQVSFSNLGFIQLQIQIQIQRQEVSARYFLSSGAMVSGSLLWTRLAMSRGESAQVEISLDIWKNILLAAFIP